MRPRAPAVVLAVLLGASVLVGAVIAACHNLSYPGMWWDESSSFWGSQGLSRYAEPFAKPDGIRNVMRMNCYENLDPGGFQLLLHLWTRVGKGLAWLRALPFAFFLLGVALLGSLGWRVSGSAIFGAASSAVPLLFPGALYFAFEIRAFSMEMAGVAAGALALVFVQERQSVAHFLLLGVTCSAFLTSRYSFVLTAAGLVCAALLAAARGRVGRRETTTRAAALLIPLLVAGASIALVITARQVWPEMQRGALGVTAPAYTRASVLSASARPGDLLLRNTLSPAALPITLAVLFILLVRRSAYASAAPPGADPRAAGSGDRLRALYIFILAVQCCSAAVSLIGIYPWDIDSRWSAYLLMVSALSAVVLAADGLALARLALARRTMGRRGGALGIVAAGIALIVAAAGLVHAASYRQGTSARHWPNIASQIDLLPVARLADRSVFVMYYQVPVLRYLYEYGPYAGRPEYPRLFRFQTVEEWASATPADAKGEAIEYVVTGLQLAQAQASFPHSTLVRAGQGECGLLRVAGPARRPHRSTGS